MWPMGMNDFCGSGVERGFPPKESAESVMGVASSGYLEVWERSLTSFKGLEASRT